MADIALFGWDFRRSTTPELEGRLLDTETGLWTMLPSMNARRARYPGVVTIEWGAGHRIYMIGGGMNGNILRSCEFIDVGDDQWTLLEAKMTTPRTCGRAILLDHTTIVICGGHDSDGSAKLASCESLDILTHTFSPFPDMLKARFDHAGVQYNGTIVVIGGATGEETCEQFDPAVFKWTPFAPLPDGGYSDAVVVESKIYVFQLVNDYVQVYNGTAWVTVAKTPKIFLCEPVAVLGGKIVVISSYSKCSDTFDPDTNSWSTITLMSQSLSELVAVSF